MRIMTKFTRASAYFGFAVATTLGLGSPVAADQTEQVMETSVSEVMDYLLYLPEDYQENEKDYPLVLYLHGGGSEDFGNDFMTQTAATGTEYPFIMVSPRNPNPETFMPIQTVKTLLDEVVASERVDENRIYLAGNSRGAYAAWLMAMQYPDQFAAVVPVSGGGIPHYLNRVAPGVDFWVFHGAQDDVISLSSSVEMVERLQGLEGERDIRFTVYPDAGHEETDRRAFTDPALFEWMLSQSKE